MQVTHTQTAIIGSGFSGMGAAIRLQEAGFNDFLIFERKQDVGGTWRDNTYPGCACDVQSVLYSFSFEQNPGWTHSFSRQPEIYAYLQGVAQKYELHSRCRFGHELIEARWDDDARIWRLTTSQGLYTADVLVSGMGALCEPMVPNLPGLASFQGESFHSARWNHDYDLTGKRVGVIGTGASAIQFVPAIQPKVDKLSLFQRTPAWVIPRLDREIPAEERERFERHPTLMKAMRAFTYAMRETMVIGFRNPVLMRLVELYARAYLFATVRDAKLRAKLTPNFRIGCKRVLVSTDYFPALTQPNVDVVTDGIREVRAHSVVTADGTEHPVDALIYGTGFHVADMPLAKIVYGRGGRSLEQLWAGSPKAHLGTTTLDAPNFFMLLGPNTGLGHTSVVLQIESQLELLIGAMKHMREKRITTVEPSVQAQSRFLADIDRSMQGTVWTAGGCASWYIDETGRNSTLWPSFTFSFRRQVRFRPEEYVFDGREQRHEAPAFGTPVTA